MKLRIQAQHLQKGDIVGSGEKVVMIVRQSVTLLSNKVAVYLTKEGHIASRGVQWGKYTMITVTRPQVIDDVVPVNPKWFEETKCE